MRDHTRRFAQRDVVDSSSIIRPLRSLIGRGDFKAGLAVIVVFWAIALFVFHRHVPVRNSLDLAGYFLEGICLAMLAISVIWRPVLDRPLPKADLRSFTVIGSPKAPRVIPAEDRIDWAEAALRVLKGSFAEFDQSPVRFSLMRSGPFGVEFLLAEPSTEAPAGFEALEDGRVWRVDPSLVLEDLQKNSVSVEGALLDPVGMDEDGTYFLLKGRGQARSLAEASVEIVEVDGTIVLEPYGLKLSPLTTGAEPVFDAVPVPDTNRHDTLVEDARDTGISADPVLVPRGEVEARILREMPDLVGDVVSQPSHAAVEFVAYLALHGRRATTTRLCDVLGTSRARGSRSVATIWAAAGEARKALLPRLVPAAVGNQIYEVAEQVSCDWNRFEELVRIAQQSEQSAHRRAALTQALELVDGVPARASNRFLWLDDEGLRARIETAVIAAAREAADVARSEGLTELAAWSIAKGRLLAPWAEELADVERSQPDASASD